jgi:DNA processing protein
MSLHHWLQLALADGLGPILQRRLVDRCGSAAGACAASVEELKTVEGIGAAKASRIHASLKAAAGAVEAEIARAAQAGVTLLCPDDAEYPYLLHSIPDPPAVLYVKGQFEPRDLNSLAIVGSRRCSHYGREQAERFAALLAGAGMTVVSGGARGIDSAAHRGALSHPHGRTIAVLGCGVDVVYPPENTSLFEQIAGRGALVSEYPLGTPPVAENFPRRNRIVSGLARGVLVIEADERSGALITARQACDDHNRPVFALPGRVDNTLSRGPHQLIRDGAVLAAGLEDILEALLPLPQSAGEASLFEMPPADELPAAVAVGEQASPPVSAAALTAVQQAVLEGMSGDATDAEQLIERTGLDAAVVMRELTLLSLRGLVRRVDGHRYALRAGAGRRAGGVGGAGRRSSGG